jgi:hypothetical protein
VTTGPRVIGVLIVMAALGGCAQLGEPSYNTAKARCEGAPGALVDAAQAKVTTSGRLRNGALVPGARGYTFLTVELWRTGQNEHRKGDLLTFATRPGDEKAFFAVDVNARDDTNWPAASFGVSATGARESRACADVRRGTTRAQLECERQQGNGPALPGTKKCSDL